MNDVLEAPVQPRRFQTADLNTHAKWMLPRLLQAFPHLTERAAAAWLTGICDNNDFLFLRLPHAVGLAQVSGVHTLAPRPLVRERFVWCEDVTDKDQLAAAASLYGEFAQWGKKMGCDVLLVEEMTDVPHDLIKAQLGRVFSRQEQFARL